MASHQDFDGVIPAFTTSLSVLALQGNRLKSLLDVKLKEDLRTPRRATEPRDAPGPPIGNPKKIPPNPEGTVRHLVPVIQWHPLKLGGAISPPKFLGWSVRNPPVFSGGRPPNLRGEIVTP